MCASEFKLQVLLRSLSYHLLTSLFLISVSTLSNSEMTSLPVTTSSDSMAALSSSTMVVSSAAASYKVSHLPSAVCMHITYTDRNIRSILTPTCPIQLGLLVWREFLSRSGMVCWIRNNIILSTEKYNSFGHVALLIHPVFLSNISEASP